MSEPQFSVNGFMHKKILAFLCLVTFSWGLWCAEPTVKIDSLSETHIPDWLFDFRDAEIVAFGSLPFVTLDVTLGYTLVRYLINGFNPDYIPNPLAKSSAAGNLSSGEQMGIAITAGVISLGLGIADFLMATHRRRSSNQEILEENQRVREKIEILKSGKEAD